jgi:hypothetical protein
MLRACHRFDASGGPPLDTLVEKKEDRRAPARPAFGFRLNRS